MSEAKRRGGRAKAGVSRPAGRAKAGAAGTAGDRMRRAGGGRTGTSSKRGTGAAPGAGAARRGGSSGPVTTLSHVAIATREADALAVTLAGALGATRGVEEILDGGALRVVFLHLGPVTLELLEPRSPEHTVARFLEARGPGLHHVCLEVGDLPEALSRARAAGVRLIDEAPRPGAHGTQVAFLHPKSLGGVLIELCARAPKPGA